MSSEQLKGHTGHIGKTVMLVPQVYLFVAFLFAYEWLICCCLFVCLWFLRLILLFFNY